MPALKADLRLGHGEWRFPALQTPGPAVRTIIVTEA